MQIRFCLLTNPVNNRLSETIDQKLSKFTDVLKIVGAVLTMSDIAARKQAELELSEARQILSNLLTLREKEILKLMVNGSSTKEIAFDLNISHLAVEADRQNMMTKLESGDMSMLVSIAVAHKLVPVS